MTTPTTDVAVRTTTAPASRTPVNVGVPIKGLDEAFRLAQALSMAGLLPSGLRGKPSDVLAIILYGSELGIGPMQALQAVHIVQGRTVVSAQLWLALLRTRGHRAKVIENTDTVCTVELQRGDTGETHRETFTWDDAKKAKLTSKDVWQSYPKRMLLARAVANAARFLVPEAVLGIAAEGEFFDEEPQPGVIRRIVEQVPEPVDAAPSETLAQVQALADELASEGLQKAPEPEGEPAMVWEQ
jgi:hypothetical protein